MSSVLDDLLAHSLAQMAESGRLKGEERVISSWLPGAGGRGPRCRLLGQGERDFIRFNSNSYLGLDHHPAVLAAAERAGRKFGAGPGAVRFISGTWQPHVLLEERLARFHQRPAALLFNSAYAAVLGTLAALITPESVVVSDALNHNCIINGIRLGRPLAKEVYDHGDMAGLSALLKGQVGVARRIVVVSDGVFSMRGDHAPLAAIKDICQGMSHHFPEGIVTLVDDSHGVAALGATGRGTEEVTGGAADILIATLGKGFGVEGGYVAGSATLISYLRQTAPLYIYSNPVSPAAAAAAVTAVDLVASDEGGQLLARLAGLRQRLQEGLMAQGWEIIKGDHPIVPLMVRDTARTTQLCDYLFARNILATALNFPVVPRGDEEIRFQVSASHSPADIKALLDLLAAWDGGKL
ncbi:MAG: aminotransferase class I/II-fold pyridoxal phosphate-dependent enzyme [Thermodesulfobacteriota bacterium]